MNLAELQRYFARVATSTSGPPEDLARVFKDSPRLPARELMRIYNRGYHHRLLGALASVFERTREALGQAEFERLGLSYLARFPSQHPAVERVGRHFAEFLAESGAVSAVCRDLARLEWARLLALVAPDPPTVLSPRAVDAARFPAQTLKLAPALSVLALHPDALARFAGSSSTPAAASSEPGAAEPRGVVVFRHRHSVVHELIEPREREALERALAGETVGRVCTAFDTGQEATDVSRAFAVISKWFAREWIAHLSP